MAATSGSIFASSAQPSSALRSISSNNASQPVPSPLASNFLGSFLSRSLSEKKKVVKISGKVCAAMAVATFVVEEIKEFTLPSWAMFELGKAPVYWKTMNGLPPTSGERLRIFYDPAATNLAPNDTFGIAFNGGFNQPIMCGGEARAMQKKARGKADFPIYTIQICSPKHALNLIFLFTNGVAWDGPYRPQFQGLAEELGREGACERAIFPDASIIVDGCAMIGNLSKEGGDRCNLNLVPGCTDPSSPMYNPLANVDDGSCLIDTEEKD